MALKEKILDRAQKYMLKGNFDKALAEYRSAVDVDPRDISVRLRIGDLYVKTNSLPEAIKEYTEVARANAQRGFYPKAIAVYKKVLKLDDSILDVHYKLAELYTKQRLIADAISSYSYIVSTFEKKGKTSEVMELLKKMLDIDPDNVGIRLKLADLFLKLSFEKDAVTEYAQIFAKLIAEGKVDRAEKVFLSLYNVRPNEPVILKALAQIYKSKGDNAKFATYARPLLKTYTKNEDIGGALALCKSILSVFPDDAAALVVMRGIEPPELIHQRPAGTAASQSPVPEMTGQGQSSESDFSVAASRVTGKESGEAEQAEQAGEAPLMSWPEEDIVISVVGFDEEQAASAEPVEDAFKEEEEFVVIGSEVHAPEVPDAEEPAQVEVPAPAEGSFIEEEVPVEAAAEEVLATEEEFAIEESPVDEPIQIEEPAPVEDAEEAVSDVREEEAEVEIDLGDYGMDRSIALASVEEPVFEEEAPVEAAVEETVEAAAEEVLATEEEFATEKSPVDEPIQIEEPTPAEDIPIEEPVVEEPTPVEEPAFEEEAPVEVATEEVLAAGEELAVEESIAEEPASVEEPAFEEEAPVEVAAEEVLAIEEELAVEEPIDIEEPAPVDEPFDIEEPAPVEEPIQIEEPLETIEHEPEESIEEAVERVLSEEPPFVVDVEDVPEREMEAASEADAPAVVEDMGPGVTAPPVPEADESAAESMESIELDDELSSAIEEIQARMESDDMLLEPEKVKIEESAPESEFIDLSAELGMEEALEGLAGTWTRNEGESTDAFDEYKDGMGQQLSKEDTETHYNLGIAYMEMELFDEASKEFKIALKEHRLEGDCYARLGLCAMAESKPDEAVMFYLKGLKVEGKSEDERKGMMYELALAYEAAGDTDEAFQLFTSINDLDPDYREVVEKLSGFERGRPYIPSDDGLIEVELL